MTTLLALLGFAFLFVLAGLVPLRGEGGGCGSCVHQDDGGCSAGRCELDAVEELLREVERSAGDAGQSGWRSDR